MMWVHLTLSEKQRYVSRSALWVYADIYQGRLETIDRFFADRRDKYNQDVYNILRNSLQNIIFGEKHGFITPQNKENIVDALTLHEKVRNCTEPCKLVISEDQAQMLRDALEIYSRFYMGQFDVINMFFYGHEYHRTTARDILDMMKRAVFPELDQNAYYGIMQHCISDNARIAWDVHQVIRHALSWKHHPEGGMTVNFDTPWRSSFTEELPKIELVD